MSRQAIKRASVAVSALVFSLVLMVPAHAEDINVLNNTSSGLKQAVSTQQSSVAQAQVSVTAAQQAVTDAATAVGVAEQALSQAKADAEQAGRDLDGAKQLLAAAEQALADAQAEELTKAAELDAANQVVAAAEQKVRDGEAAITAQKEAIKAYAMSIMQDSMPLVNVAVLLNGDTSADLSNRVQWGDTVLGTNQVDLDALEDLQIQLEKAKKAADDARAMADAAKQAATEQVNQTASAAEAAQTAKNQVQAAYDAQQRALVNQQAAVASQTQALSNQQAAEATARVGLETEQAELAALEAEQADVDRRIAAEYARAEAERQAAANKPAGNGVGGAPSTPTSSAGLIRPIGGGSMTSSYGWRIHPIYGTWRFHDGTDFGVGCGTPIKAAAAGQITQQYYHSGYGNRIFVDHGFVGGKHMVTAYNHLSGYALKTGTWVSQGQIIGYVGTTGASTGCHLHLMLWVNGGLVNPVNYLP
ncbi:MAG: peptidoglycan DD-metalloendopeptidase family protein [Propionibacteriaceae bacterium]|jgi:murein DD-endopeptidase MepM/ murein hydrolase activator NlpD|nr:peptidoglycan DD-metalloendopeptidase family protein [Propionibacteriaceae bacterium]